MIDLELIKARVDAAMLDGSWDEPDARDREALLAEVERLRVLVDADEVERLRGVIARLQVERHHLVEQLIQMGSDPS